MADIDKQEEEIYEEVEDVAGDEGMWVVVHKGETVQSSYDSEKMYQFAERFPPEDVFVTKILFAGACFY
ncbi:MAG: hypothetical protein U9R75_00045 [Candidatus Thermoplasmatota archaeon]|nr:hypothetical protein [Candidatus Thermoplasmatota archaeon]